MIVQHALEKMPQAVRHQTLQAAMLLVVPETWTSIGEGLDSAPLRALRAALEVHEPMPFPIWLRSDSDGDGNAGAAQPSEDAAAASKPPQPASAGMGSNLPGAGMPRGPALSGDGAAQRRQPAWWDQDAL